MCTFLLHAHGQFPDGSLQCRTLLFLLSGECAHTPFQTTRGAETRSSTASSFGANSRRLPAVQQGLIAGELVQQWVTGRFSTAIGEEHLEKINKYDLDPNELRIVHQCSTYGYHLKKYIFISMCFIMVKIIEYNKNPT